MVACMAAPALAQSGGFQASPTSPVITLNHTYTITPFGLGLLNDTISFKNNGTATEQIPNVELGIPENISSHATGFALEPSSQYSMTSDNINGVTLITITPGSPSLAAGLSSKVTLATYFTGILNFTLAKTTGITALLLLSPSLNQKVSTIQRNIVLPSSGTLTPAPKGFNASAAAQLPTYTNASSDVMPVISTEKVVFNATDEATFQPIQIFSVVRTIAPSSNGTPQVEDLVTFRNLADYEISSLPLTLLGNVTQVTVLPSSGTPLINPTPVTLTNGALSLTTAPFVAAVKPGDNFTFEISYSVPSSLVTTSATTVTVEMPYTLPIDSVAQEYTAQISLPAGFDAVGDSVFHTANASSLTQTKLSLSYNVVPGSGADQAVPIATAVFAAAFILMIMRRPETESEKESEEGEEESSTKLTDLTKSFEDKIALIEKIVEEMEEKEQGTVARADLIKNRSELDSLRSRAMHRLSEAKQSSKSQRFTDLLSQIQEAAREEDRAAKDLLNLYEQYQTRRMREDTFERLLPNYKKRLGTATNKLSDLLGLIPKEGTET